MNGHDKTSPVAPSNPETGWREFLAEAVHGGPSASSLLEALLDRMEKRP